MESIDALAATAEAQLQQGEPLSAYNTAQSGLELEPGHARLRQLQALALARSGDIARANAMLAALAAEGFDDAETLGMLARTHKDLGLRSTGEARGAHLRSSFDLYERAYRAAIARGDQGGAGYTGINAAALAALQGDLPRARKLAAEVRRMPHGKSPTYWDEATRGEAALILGEMEAAREHYARSAKLAARRHGDLATTRRQARLLEDCLPRVNGRVSDALSIPPVLVFSGHMIDAPGRASPRFP